MNSPIRTVHVWPQAGDELGNGSVSKTAEVAAHLTRFAVGIDPVPVLHVDGQSSLTDHLFALIDVPAMDGHRGSHVVYRGNRDPARRRSGCVRPMRRKRATASPYPDVRMEGSQTGNVAQRTPAARHISTCLRSARGTRQKHSATPTKNRTSGTIFGGLAIFARHSDTRHGFKARIPDSVVVPSPRTGVEP